MRFTVDVLDVLDGKYTYVADEKGSRALRYGEEWRDLTGDKFVYSLTVEVDSLRVRQEKLIAFVEEYVEACKDANGVGFFRAKSLQNDAEKLLDQIKRGVI